MFNFSEILNCIKMELLNLKTFNTEIEAEMVKAYLEAQGVKGFVFGTVLANTYNIFNTTSGGVVLKVREIDFDKAKQLLNDYFSNNREFIE